jgi:hypothetical protein
VAPTPLPLVAPADGQPEPVPGGPADAEHDGPRDDAGDDGDGDVDEGDDGDDGEGKGAVPADVAHDGSLFSSSAVGCAAAGAVPLVTAAGGLGLFYGFAAGGGASVCGVVGALGGAVLAIPALLALGPCAVGGAACGGAVGAALNNLDAVHAVLWTLPALAVGVLGGVAATAGLVVTMSAAPSWQRVGQVTGTTLLATGAVLAFVAGPLAVGGASVTARAIDDDEPASTPITARGLAPRTSTARARSLAARPSPPSSPSSSPSSTSSSPGTVAMRW